ncbi:unnamed protein product [Paramecium primaurelia]|uniref:SURF1-like protein n=1 Tax=Paramecium primaurelia TaxID=5886 RepID=A0A8S1JQW9_PARPR|nr:unnamed protein product [Paramecium primaurelia]
MLSTQVFNSFAQRQSNGIIKLLAYGVFFGGAYGCVWHQWKGGQQKQLYEKVENEITEWKPININGLNASRYPWAQNIRQWEYKLVKLYGYFRDERFFVRREREGRDGFLVFAPFVTALQFNDTEQDPEQTTKSQVMVNLGWVPKDNISDIQMGQEPIGTTTYENVPHNEDDDQLTGFNRNIANMEEDYQMPFVEFVGMVRRGEEEDILKGRRNWPREGVYNYIDLWFMSKLYRSFNLTDSSAAYIERLVQEYDEESANLYPIPATKDNFDKPLPTPQTHQAYSLFFGLSSVMSLALLAIRR